MKFTLNCAADLYQSKVNLELAFPTFPSLADLHRQVETAFSIESSVLRPPGVPFSPFKLSRFQMFDERLGQWVDLISSSQLYEGVQVYAFQPQSERNEQQKQIPPARLPSSATRSAPSLPSSPLPTTSPAMHLSPPRPIPAASPAQIHASPAPERSFNTPSSPFAKPLPDVSNLSIEAKVRAVFDETDINRNRLIELDEFRRIFKLLNLDFTTATISDLYARADADRDGVVSMGEFQHFAQFYPTLLDSLFYRSKELQEENRRRAVLNSQQQATEEAKNKERMTQQSLEDARRDLMTQEKNLGLSEQDLQNKLIKERDMRANTNDAKKEAERAAAARLEKERDVAAGKERERQRQAGINDAQRLVDAAEKRLVNNENEMSRAQEKERQLEALLAEARRETEKQKQSLHHAAAELAAARDREQQALSLHADAQIDVQRLNDLLAQAELELARKAEKEREADAFLNEAQREAARAAHRRDEEERELQLQRERELHHNRLHQDAARLIEECERAARQLEKDLADYLARRQQVEAQENELIEQEIRLREQRFNLEEREGKLRNQAQSFLMAAGRTEGGTRSPPRRL